MTKKEKLATEYIELKKKFDGSDFKENIVSNQVRWLVNEFKGYELEDKIEAVKRAIEEKEFRLKKEAFYNTPEGKEYKKYYENNKNNLIKVRKKIISEVEDFVMEFLDEYVGNGWGCRFSHSYDRCNLTVGITSISKEIRDKGYFFEFGHEFDVTWDMNNFGRGETIEMNYGTLGSFNLETNELRPNYIMGMAIFCNDKKWIANLKEKFRDTNTKLMEIDKSFDEINKMIEYPKI